MSTVEYKSATPLNLKRSEISLFVDNLYHSRNFRHKNIENVLEKSNGNIVYKEGYPNINFASLEVNSNGFTIYISKDSTPLRERVEIANAIGHWTLHYRCHRENGKHLDTLIVDRNTDQVSITEAGWFGAELLMPKEEYVAMHKQFDGDHLLLSAYFQVPISSSKLREASLQSYLQTV